MQFCLFSHFLWFLYVFVVSVFFIFHVEMIRCTTNVKSFTLPGCIHLIRNIVKTVIL